MTLPPYPEYKPSGVDWLGEIPAHWDIVPLYGEYAEKQVKNTGLVENTVLSLSYGRIVIKPLEKLHGLVPESFETYQIVDPGDIIIRPTDLQNDHTSLRIGFSQYRGIITSAYMCLRTWNDLSPEYGYHVLNVFDLTKAIYAYGSGLRQNLSFDDLKRVGVPVPPPDEQAAIVRFLDAAETRIRRYIRAKQKLIKLLNEQKQAIIQQAVTRGLNPDAPMKDSGVEWYDQIPNHWEVVSMRRVIFSAIDGPHFSPSYLDEGIPFLSARNIKENRWQLDDVKFISEDDYIEFSKRVVPEIDDILYTKGGTTGVARVVDLDFRFQVWVHVAVLKVNKQLILPEYLATVLNSSRCYEQSQLFTRGATNQDLGLGRMQNISFPLPPSLTEQEAILHFIARKIEPLYATISQAGNQIDLIREYRTRLIADVVTGKVDVRDLAFDMPEAFDDDDLLDVDDEVYDEDDVFEELSDE